MAKKGATQTFIRTLYSDISYMSLRFYNNSLSITVVPAVGKDQNGFNQYQKSNDPSRPAGVFTAISYSVASTLMNTIETVIKPAIVNNTDVSVIINSGKSNDIILERKSDEYGHKKIFLTVKNSQMTVPFKFTQNRINITENGTSVTRYDEGDLRNFVSIIKGYLEGINAERHLNKLIDDFAKSQEGHGDNNNGGNSNNNRRGSYNRNGGNFRNYNRNGNNNNYNNQPPQQTNPNDIPPWEIPPTNQTQSIGISTYTIDQ